MTKMFPVIDLAATGENIVRLRKARGLTVRDLQDWFGFEQPQAIYKWQKGKSLPTIDNLYALGVLLDVPVEEILVRQQRNVNMTNNGQQEFSCCPPYLVAHRDHVTICAGAPELPHGIGHRKYYSNKNIQSVERFVRWMDWGLTQTRTRGFLKDDG